ncbi:hypothetical protein ANCDUO_12931 [Ancylostoma duodenale]|uniref:GIY-YIG domain-containing protein n=1 Tax=Ancylostoma duodenale TaxID=51022 RepID=A0A0C2G7I1_9BILA|nr:hypothetical protein ANCDUO_12931 [Ancylostoma duodenale]
MSHVFTILLQFLFLHFLPSTSCYYRSNSFRKNSYSTKLRIYTQTLPNCHCSSANVIYCITCNDCGLQYDGLTTRKIKLRIKEHLYHINNQDVNSYLYNHFNEKKCSNRSIQVAILDDIPENTDKNILSDKELFWIKLLNTTYPLVLMIT